MVALNQTLVLHEKIRRNKAKLTYSTRELIYHYNCGDLTDILYSQKMSSLTNLENSSDSDSFVVEQTRKIDEYFRDELIYRGRYVTFHLNEAIFDVYNYLVVLLQ